MYQRFRQTAENIPLAAIVKDQHKPRCRLLCCKADNSVCNIINSTAHAVHLHAVRSDCDFVRISIQWVFLVAAGVNHLPIKERLVH